MINIDEYVHYYEILRQAMGDIVPLLSRTQIPNFISKEGWLGVPIEGETSLDDVKKRDGSNVFFSIREHDIRIGISFTDMKKVKVFFNLFHAFHAPEINSLESALIQLGPEFVTTLYRQSRPNHFSQSPDSTVELEFVTREMNSEKLEQFRMRANTIIKEGRQWMTEQKKTWPIYTPDIDLSNVIVEKEDSSFFGAAKGLAPVYKISISLKTDKEIKKELKQAEIRKESQKMNRYTGPKCGTVYSREQRDKTMFCECDTHRATWKQG